VLPAALPESVGGSGLGLIEQRGVLVELGRAGDVGRAAGDLVLTAALSEETGDGATTPATTARRASADARRHLHGTKACVQASMLADAFLVPAETAPD
jgi:acyl-CoA dehydrogenase